MKKNERAAHKVLCLEFPFIHWVLHRWLPTMANMFKRPYPEPVPLSLHYRQCATILCFFAHRFHVSFYIAAHGAAVKDEQINAPVDLPSFNAPGGWHAIYTVNTLCGLLPWNSMLLCSLKLFEPFCPFSSLYLIHHYIKTILDFHHSQFNLWGKWISTLWKRTSSL